MTLFYQDGDIELFIVGYHQYYLIKIKGILKVHFSFINGLSNDRRFDIISFLPIVMKDYLACDHDDNSTIVHEFSYIEKSPLNSD